MPQITASGIIAARNWQHYLTRPFTLFGASLWHAWYTSPQIKQCLGITCPDVLFLEESPNVARCYRPREQIHLLNDAVHTVIFDKKRAIALFEEGLQLNEHAKGLLEGKHHISNFPEAVQFLTDITLKAAIIPNRVGAFLDTHKKPSKEVIGLMEQLRKVSYYPRIIEEVVMPLARQHLQKSGIQDARITDFLTLQEFFAGTFEKADERLAAHLRGESYCYAMVDGKEIVLFVQDITHTIDAIEPMQKGDGVKGQIACSGKAQGTVRIVNTGVLKEVVFNEGDILVSISTTPLYLPLMKKAGAIVVDEGGLASHAAILARELGKPCIIGTGNATRTLKEGDVVEVDAEKGVVKKVR